MNNVSWRFPEATARDLNRALLTLVRDLVVRMRANTKRLKFDDEVANAQDDNENYSRELIAAFLALLPAIALSAYKYNTREFIRIAKKTGGAKNPIILLLIAYGANANEDWYAPKFRIWQQMAKDSVERLVNNILDDWNTQIRNAELHEYNKKRTNDIIEQRFRTYKAWAARRAMGIIGSWNSALMYQRCVDSGVTHYLWRGQLDDREREKHLRWEGKRIALNSQHVFPGEEINCRCWAQPDWSTKK